MMNKCQMDKYKNKYRITSSMLPNWDYNSNAGYYITIFMALSLLVKMNLIQNRLVETRCIASLHYTTNQKITEKHRQTNLHHNQKIWHPSCAVLNRPLPHLHGNIILISNGRNVIINILYGMILISTAS